MRNPQLTAARQRRYHLKKAYGLSEEQYDAMVEAQGGRCAICEVPEERLYVDHCHASGDIRWLLCVKCNTGLGMFEDNPERMRKAADMLHARKL